MARPRREHDALRSGLVIAAHGRSYRVELGDGNSINCATRGKRSDAACGDHVQVLTTGAGTGVIETIEPRRSLFYRSDAYRQKLIAANITQAVIVVAAEPRYHEDLLNRCLVAAEHAAVAAVIALNKADLPQSAAAVKSLDLYHALGYSVIVFSAKHDLSPLSARLSDHVTLLVGQSGMGKSTIVNALVPDAAARVSAISAALKSGRHTTTHAELYRLDPSSAIVDSPGLQEFGLHHLTLPEAAHAFVEFRPLLGQCRFRDCLHLNEPDCALIGAVKEGSISEQRLGSYQHIARELARKQAWR